jgi:hypothetical protein
MEMPDLLTTKAQTFLRNETPNSLSSELLNHPVTILPACSSTKIQMPLTRRTKAVLLPPADFPISTYPPSLPTSVEITAKLEFRMTYSEATSRGNLLLCLPRHVRKRIYTYLLAEYPELSNIEIPETGDFSRSFPGFCHSLDIIYFDTCLLIIENTTFTLSSDGAIFNLMVFLNEFSDKGGYNAVQSLEFAGRTMFGKEETALGMFEKGKFTSNATELLRRCPNVKNISLVLSMKRLPWTDEDGAQVLNIMKLTKKYDLESIIKLSKLEIVTLSLTPFMALENTVKSMEKTTKNAQRRGFMGPGLEGFWGLKGWMEMQALDQMRLIEVRCPTLEQLA